MADKELEQTRKAVTGTMNDLFDTVQTEVYEETIKELKEHITLLENELDKYRELLQDEIKNAQFYKTGFNFMQKVKTITVT
ncbi:MAG: hypothetical protein J6B88_00150 [Clostridia bacterium]|nr:hypothetical protein [Clostridia bacterium]